MNGEGQNHSRLFYYGTDIEVQIGDRVFIKRWFRSDLFAVVCYIPGISRCHQDLEYEDVKKWAVRYDNGTLGVMGYGPENRYGQPLKDLVFVGRGEGGELSPDVELV
jgi:hypothetical protein